MKKKLSNHIVEEFLDLRSRGSSFSEVWGILRDKYKTRWRSASGVAFEKIIEKWLNSTGLHRVGLRVVRGSELPELAKKYITISSKRKCLQQIVHLAPDRDLPVLNGENRVVAVLSLKTSLRERLQETIFWKLLLPQIPFVLVTPDMDKELGTCKKPRKARVLAECFLDGVYVIGDVNECPLVKKIEELPRDLIQWHSAIYVKINFERSMKGDGGNEENFGGEAHVL